ncbi:MULTISPECIES: hypothetical protein [unclassified Kribbella]|uniref:hypothetical protein n=1 Tax=unclassified Kribbella TaxID=2644121 RepID=UPI00301690A6
MSVLERLSAETRRRTGWLVPVTAGWVAGAIAPGSGEVVGRSTQLWYGGLGLAGVLIGLWRFSPRELAERLFVAGGAFLLLCVLLLLPIEGELREDQYVLYFCLGIVAGLILATRLQRAGTAKPAEQSPGT